MTIVNPDAELLVITARGMGKRSRLGHGIADQDLEISGGGYRLTRRGGKGVTSIKLKPGDTVVQALQLEQDEDLIITSFKGLVVRINTADIRTLGRSSQGVRIMRLREDDVVGVVTKVAKLDGEESPIPPAERQPLPEGEPLPDEPDDLEDADDVIYDDLPEDEVFDDEDEGPEEDEDQE
jgi:DNA gyrase subunit A